MKAFTKPCLGVFIALLLLSHWAIGGSKNKAVSVQNFTMHPAFSFIQNKGQLADENGQLLNDIKYYGQDKGIAVYCRANKLSFVFTKITEVEDNNAKDKILPTKFKAPAKTTIDASRMDMELANANPNPEILAEDVQPTKTNYYLAHTGENGITNVASYKKLSYRNIYTNIDLVLECMESGFEYSFIVHPGGRVEDIKMLWKGTGDNTILKEGHTKYICALGEINESDPVIYTAGTNKATGKELNTVNGFSRSADGIYHSFRVYGYDKTKDLVIDPVLSWSYIVNGAYDVRAYAIQKDDTNNLYIGGETLSTYGIATKGSYQIIGCISANVDAFIFKLDSNCTKNWGTYYGGRRNDQCLDLKADKMGNLFLVGSTNSSTVFASKNAFKKSCDTSSYDGFVAKFSNNGYRIWGTYFGGNSEDEILGIVIDDSDNIYITGNTNSTNGIASNNAFQKKYMGDTTRRQYDGFLAKFDSSGKYIWGTYFGGKDDDESNAIAIDHLNNIIITGLTTSDSNIASPKAHKDSLYASPTQTDAYLAKFSSTGTRIWSTYFGGHRDEAGFCVAVDDSDNIIFGGTTGSKDGIATPNTFQSQIYDTLYGKGFLSKFNSSGKLIWGTYCTDNYDDEVMGLTIDNYQNIFATGFTISQNQMTNGNLATPGAYMEANGNAFLEKFSSSGIRVMGTYYGDGILSSSSYYNGKSVIVGNAQNIILLGNIYSNNGDLFFLAKFHYYKNDAGLSKLFATDLFCKDSTPIIVELTTYGSDSLKNVTLNWSINGILMPSIALSGKIPPDGYKSFVLGYLKYKPATLYNVKAWTSKPNNLPDDNTNNDTISKLVTSGAISNHQPSSFFCLANYPWKTIGGKKLNGATYSWTSDPPGFTSTSNNPFVTVTKTTTFILKETNACGTVTDSLTLTVAPSPKIPSIFGPGSACEFSSSNFYHNKDSGNTFKWSVAGGVVSNSIYSDPVSVFWNKPHGFITVMETNKFGCWNMNTISMQIDSTCVWPGDANYDKIVDKKDILTIGLAYNLSGPVRPNATSKWHAQPCPNWSSSFIYGVNSKQADCNGDSIINAADTLVVKANYSQTHLKNLYLNQGQPSDPRLQIIFNTDSVIAGETVRGDIILGDSLIQASNFYGLAFSIIYDPALIDTVETDFANSWICKAPLSLSQMPSKGQIDIALSRINQQDTTGFGRIMSIYFKVKQTLPASAKKLSFNFVDNLQINALQQYKPIYFINDSLLIKPKSSGVFLSSHRLIQLNIFPNPFTDFTNVEYTLPVSGHIKAEIYNMLGEKITTLTDGMQASGKHSLKFVGNEAAGTYILRMQIGDEVVYKRMMLVR